MWWSESTGAKLEMSGKEAVAAEILEAHLKWIKNEGKSHEAYEIEMLLVEMHIYQVLLHYSSSSLIKYLYIYIYNIN